MSVREKDCGEEMSEVNNKCLVKDILCKHTCPMWGGREGRCVEPDFRSMLDSIKGSHPEFYKMGCELIAENAGGKNVNQ
jgi:hypothetical protein